jgi:dTDP-glucose pyrophosphorylase
MKPALVVMAAGMGSRFGGLKQMEAITGNGEVLLDFSVYDALRAGFGKIVIVIKKAIEKDFEDMVGKKLRRQAEVVYAYQELDDLPDGRVPPEGRVKPWGTGQAVLAAKNAVNEPFCVINSDDYLGKSAFGVMADFLRNGVTAVDYGMVGYKLGNTLSDHGSVARGVCEVDGGYLKGIVERVKIIRKNGGAAYTEDGGTYHDLPLDTVVSMQCFGFHPSFFNHLQDGFRDFFESDPDPLKGEYLLPSVVGHLLKSGRATMRVLNSPDRWFGVTYKEDKPNVVAEIRSLREKGVYPERLW